MTRERLYLYDTTLRDGQQSQGVDFSAEDKRRIAEALDALGLDPTHRLAHNVSQTIGLVLSVVAVGWLAIRVAQKYPMRFLSWAWLAFAVFGPALHSWYLLWGGLLLPLTRPTERMQRVAVGVTSVLLGYGAGNLAWRNDTGIALGLAGLALIITLLVRYFDEHRKSQGAT